MKSCLRAALVMSFANVPIQQHQSEPHVDRHQRRGQAVQPIEAAASRVGLRERADRSRNLGLNLIDLARDEYARVERDREHDRDDRDARDEGLGRRAHEFHHEQTRQEDRAASVRQNVEAPQDLSKHRTGQHAARRGVGCRSLHNAKSRRRDEQTEHDHAAEPHDKGRQRDITNRKHSVSIIAAVGGRAIEWLSELALQGAASEAGITPAGVTLLLRRYLATGRADVRDALGPALGYAIDACAPSEAHAALAEWLFVFVEACTFSEDERVTAAAESLIATLRSGWPSRGDLRSSMQSVDACLSAAGRLPESDAVVPAAIDELEHIVSVVYEPGEGLLRAIDRKSRAPGDLRDHVAAGSALLTAYTITGRLPYSMLAEELMQFSRRTWWDTADGGVQTSAAASHDGPE